MKPGTLEYTNLHRRICKAFAHGDRCELCGSTDRKLEWANRDHHYTENRADWMSVCHPCHARHDAPTECKEGHPLSGPNLKLGKDGRRRCRACAQTKWREGYRAGKWTGGMNGRAAA